MVEPDPFDQVMHEWIRVFTRRSMQSFARWMNQSGLSNSQISALMRLHYHGNCRISGMADDLGVTNAAASQLVDRLVSMELLERTEDSDDRRVKHVSLSPYGHKLIREGLEARLDWMHDIQDWLRPDQRETVTQALQSLVDAAQAVEAVPEVITEKI